jgi:hypothetical protein
MLKRLFKNNWAIGIGTGVLATLFLRGIDKLFINDFFWDWIKGVFNTIGDFFSTEYSVKLYFLILLPILFVAVIICIILLLSKIKDKGGVSIYPEWKGYTKDVFGDLQYRWQYDFFGKSYDIKNLQKFCNKCSCHLVDERCPVCRTNYSYGHQYPSRQEVLALIARNIDTGLYKDSAYFKT